MCVWPCHFHSMHPVKSSNPLLIATITYKILCHLNSFTTWLFLPLQFSHTSLIHQSNNTGLRAMSLHMILHLPTLCLFTDCAPCLQYPPPPGSLHYSAHTLHSAESLCHPNPKSLMPSLWDLYSICTVHIWYYSYFHVVSPIIMWAP